MERAAGSAGSIDGRGRGMANEICKEGLELLRVGMEEAIKIVRSTAMALEPLVYVEIDGDRNADRFVAPSREQAIEDALFHARSLQLKGHDSVVIIYDDYHEEPGGEKLDALWAEAYDGEGGCAILVQQYRPKKRMRRFQAIGDLVEMPCERGRFRAV
jgi:hypothetical protein